MADSTDLVTIEWKGYCSALLHGIWKIFNDQQFVDVNLTCHQQGLKVHSLILAEFFQGMRNSLTDTPGDGDGVRQLCLDHLSKDKQDADVLRYLIEFAYSGKVALPEDRLGNVLDAAEVVGFDQLVQSIRGQLDKKEAPGANARTSTGSSDGNDVDSGTAASADASVSTRPKRSNRKGIPKKLIKTPRRQGKNNANVAEVAGVSDKVSSKRKLTPNQTARAARLLKRNQHREEQRSSSDAESGERGDDLDPTSSSSSSEDDESKHEDWAEADEKKRAKGRKQQRLVASERDAGVGPKRKKLGASSTARKTAGTASATTKDKPRPKRIRIRIRPTLKCDRCEYTSTSKPRYDAHCAKHDRPAVEKVYPCTLCSRVFKTNRSLTEHQASHNPELQHKCKLCSFVTNQKWSYRHHLAVVHYVDEAGNPVAKKFGCADCGFQCVNNRQLRAHVLIKHPKNLHKCDLCNYTHPRPFRVKNHMAAVHNVDSAGKAMDQNVKCAECDYTCFTKSQMSEHVLRRHMPDKLKMCDECGYTTAFTAELRRHVKHVHRGECKYICDICGKRIMGHSGIERHKQSHLGLKPFKCTLCGQAFADRRNLKAHNERHAKKNEGPNVSGMDEANIPSNFERNCETDAELTAGNAAKSVIVSSSVTSKLAADAMASGSSDLARAESSTSKGGVHRETAASGRKVIVENRMAYDAVNVASSVERLACLGGMLDGYVVLREAVERFEGLGSCGGIFQEL